MSNMAANDRRRFGFWLTIALLLVGTIIGLGLANRPAAAPPQSARGTGALTSFTIGVERPVVAIGRSGANDRPGLNA